MKALVQRVKSASVEVEGEVIGDVQQGLLVFLGVEKGDAEEHVEKLLRKVLGYRVFSDEQGKMNLSLTDIGGELLVVSQFTLAADTRKGMRPSFSSAGEPVMSERLYNCFIESARQEINKVEVGKFGADMKVSLVNDGPVTFMLEV